MRQDEISKTINQRIGRIMQYLEIAGVDNDALKNQIKREIRFIEKDLENASEESED